MGDDAVKNKRPLYFGDNGGVKQHLNWAQKRYAILAAIKPDAAETAAEKKKLDDAQTKVKEMKASLTDSIIENNKVPPEQYNGPDKAQLIELVKKKWSESGVKGDVLKIGINSRQMEPRYLLALQRHGYFRQARREQDPGLRRRQNRRYACGDSLHQPRQGSHE